MHVTESEIGDIIRLPFINRCFFQFSEQYMKQINTVIGNFQRF